MLVESHAGGAYVAVRQQRTRSFGDCAGPRSFVFVDNALAGEYTALRRVPASVLRNEQATILVRANRPLPLADARQARRRARWRRLLGGEGPELSEEAAGVGEVIEQWGLRMPVGLLHQPVGEPPWIEPVQGEPHVELARARALELTALLDWGEAVWHPRDFHYRLPSGEHAAGFVKLGDAIREPRDAEVLAGWLTPYLRQGTGFVLDTGTLTPIYEAAVKRASQVGLDLGRVAVLEHYPRTSVDVDDAVEYAAGGPGRVLALLSVNSSGSVRDRIVAAMDRIVGLDEPRLIVLVDKDRPPERERIETWSPLRGEQPLVKRGAAARESCQLCAGSKQPRLVPINPFSFDGMTQGELQPIMPSVKDAQANSDLWQRCSAADAVAIEAPSELAGSVARASGHPMTVRIDVKAMLKSEEFREVVASRFEALLSSPPPKDEDPLAKVRWSRRPLKPDSDLVLMPARELEHPSFEAFWSRVGSVIAPEAKLVPFPGEGEPDETLSGTIAASKKILIFALGSVSGHSMQRALYGVQQSHRAKSYELQGLVLHARLPTSREWQTLCNSFDHDLHAGWVFFLPEGSPLREENKALQRLRSADYAGVTRDFLDRRLRLCSGEVIGSKPPLFWGSESAAQLTRNSIFGQQLDARTTFAAVGAAMARARVDHDRRTPEMRVFDLAGMIRSYYDPLILSAFFRWLGPYEAWWGWQSWEAERTIHTLFGRIEDDEGALGILVPELLLATAQGKLHEAAVDAVRAQAEALRKRAAPEVAAAIEVGLALAGTLESASVPQAHAA